MEEREELEPREAYEPRPLWQVWCARIGLALFILFVVWQIANIASGGL